MKLITFCSCVCVYSGQCKSFYCIQAFNVNFFFVLKLQSWKLCAIHEFCLRRNLGRHRTVPGQKFLHSGEKPYKLACIGVAFLQSLADATYRNLIKCMSDAAPKKISLISKLSYALQIYCKIYKYSYLYFTSMI